MNQQNGDLASTRSLGAAPLGGWAGRLWLALYWMSVLVGALCALVLVQTRSVMWDTQAPWWPRLVFGGAFFVSLAVAIACSRRLYRNPVWRRNWLFTHPLAGMVGICCIAMVLLTVKATVLPWPMREMRPNSLNVSKTAVTEADLPWGTFTAESAWECQFNSWGMRDVERTAKKDPNKYRVLFLGDSFLEGGFCRAPISIVCQLGLPPEAGRPAVECINLGISGTSPVDYYHRLKNVGQALSPDAVCLFIYSGNDYLQPNESYRPDSQQVFEQWIADRPRPSILGQISPDFAWVLQNRWNAWKARRAPQGKPIETETLTAAPKLPFREGVHLLAEYCHKHYFPQHDVSKLEEILGRGGPEWWAELREKPRDSEALQGWLLANLITWETGSNTFARSADDVASHQVLPHVAATATWIQAIQRQCDEIQVPLVVFLIPMGNTDPDLKKFWEPWPAYHSFAFYQNARHAELSRQLKQSNMNFVDLWETLDGVPGSYRKTDSHWTEKGHQLVANRVVPEIRSLLDSEAATVARQPTKQDRVLR